MRYSFMTITILIISFGLLFYFPNRQAVNDYESKWQTIDSLEQIGLYQQAYRKVVEIYDQAKNDHKASEELKALIYKLRFINVLSEDGYPEAIRELEKEINDDRLVFHAIKTSMLGEMYTRYYQHNRWQIFNNSTYQSPDVSNPETWSPAQFGAYIDALYQKSLKKPELLSSVNLDEFQSILSDSLLQGNDLTVFDLLSKRAMEFYELDELDYSPDPLPQILLDTMLFYSGNKFVEWLADNSEGNSFIIRSLKIHAELLRHHNNDKDFATLLYNDLSRLSYALRIYLPDDGEERYLRALDNILESIETDSLRAEVYYEKAQFYFNRSGRLRMEDKKSEIYKDDRKSALIWAQKALDQDSGSLVGVKSQNIINQITAPSLRVAAENFSIPKRHLPLSIEYSNLTEIWYWITPVSPATPLNMGYFAGQDKANVFIEGNSPLASGKFNLPDIEDYNQHRVTVDLPPMLEGNYQLLLSGSSNPDNKDSFISSAYLRVSNFSWISQVLDDGSLEVNIVDRGSGIPMEGVNVKQYFRSYDNRSREEIFTSGGEFISDNQGQINIKSKPAAGNSYRNESFHLHFGSEKYGVISTERFNLYFNKGEDQTRTSQRIFTDRGIYRPGQLVQFSGLLVNENIEGLKAEKDRAIEVFFQDSKYKTLDTLILRTDDFGFFNGSFTIPDDALNGRFQILTSIGGQGLQVEQYKRPGFKIQFDSDKRIYFPGDSIYINGRAEAFAGSVLKDSEIQIDAFIEIQNYYPYRSLFPGRKIKVGMTNAKLDDLGRFSWVVKSIDLPGKIFSSANYEFRVKIKDRNGETRELSNHVIISKSPILASLHGPTKINRKEKSNWEITARSNEGRPLQAPVLVRVGILNKAEVRQLPYPLPAPDTWIIEEKIWDKIFPRIPCYPNNEQDSVSKILLSTICDIDTDGFNFNPNMAGWYPGRYRIMLSLPDSPEKLIGQFDFELYDSKLKAFPIADPIWMAVKDQEYKPGETLEYFCGVRYPGLYLLEISGRDTSYLKKWLSLDNRLLKQKLVITNEMQGNLSIQLNGVYENNLFSKSLLVNIPWENKDLRIFGLDSIPIMNPGDSVELPVIVKDNLDKPVSIRGVITIYDSSLDELFPHTWNGFKWPTINSAITYRSGAFGVGWARLQQSPQIEINPLKVLPEPRINWFGLGYYGINRFDNREMSMQPATQSLKTGVANEGGGQEVELYSVADEQVIEGRDGKADIKAADQSLPPYFRTDFRETASFISSFKTDEKGEALIRFTVPEAMTKWKVKVYGHDGEMAQVKGISDFQSQKTLMLLPNFPRFVRVGDEIELKVNVVYDGLDKVKATARLQVENQFEKSQVIFEEAQEIDMVAGDQATLVWKFEVPESLVGLKIKVSCRGGDLSDGLSVDIPVLPRVLSFWDSKNFFLGGASKTLVSSGPQTEKAVLELNTQPLWLAIQSLPVDYGNEMPCSEFWFTRYYTSKLIQKISTENPGIADRLKKLSKEMETDPRLNAFLKNDEMRSFVLGSGLWEGADEEEAIHLSALASSFDPEENEAEIKKSFLELSSLQLEDGSWPWFRGMRPDFQMTMHILGGLGELVDMQLESPLPGSAMERMLQKAVNSLDRTIYERYNHELIRQPDLEPALYGDVLYYLYVRSFYKKYSIQDNYKAAYDYYFDKAGQDWLNWSISQQVFIALSYHRSGEVKLPNLIINSLLDRKLNSAGGGIFWKVEPQFRNWYDRDIWQQSRLIEFFGSLPGGEEHLDALRTWLIQQKRSRDWGDRISTSLAVKSLILYGSDWYSDHSAVTIESNEEQFSPLRIDLGTDLSGHYRYSWEKADLSGTELELKISKADKLPVWGSLFVNKTIGIDTLDASGTDLVVRRLVLAETEQEGQNKWIPVEETNIRAGQRIIIRLEVEALQAIDYVQLRDFRPAAFEPDKSLSGYRWGNGISWYQIQADQFTDFYIPHLPKGFSFFEYRLFAEQSGAFSSGYAEIQSQYAPEFIGRSKGGLIQVK